MGVIRERWRAYEVQQRAAALAASAGTPTDMATDAEVSAALTIATAKAAAFAMTLGDTQ